MRRIEFQAAPLAREVDPASGLDRGDDGAAAGPRPRLPEHHVAVVEEEELGVDDAGAQTEAAQHHGVEVQDALLGR
ncbi:hypothetical protein [Streptomyces sp. SM1]|uniref:hypothetical protein n=1 Tax=Streptomyces sp. SM1 TaxID=402229 RepID=UPI001CA5D32B|nr:hypothetical protein [Streptomyces sp. SM1]